MPATASVTYISPARRAARSGSIGFTTGGQAPVAGPDDDEPKMRNARMINGITTAIPNGPSRSSPISPATITSSTSTHSTHPAARFVVSVTSVLPVSLIDVSGALAESSRNAHGGVSGSPPAGIDQP